MKRSVCDCLVVLRFEIAYEIEKNENQLNKTCNSTAYGVIFEVENENKCVGF